ncbi:MAG: hypothetical protein U0T73_09070 [Chitinophagales bacterium]
MILVADSGSTKTNWLAYKDGECIETIGFNPFFHTSENVISEIGKSEWLLHIAPQVQQLYFYGAGCSSASRNAIIDAGLRHHFKNASIVVDHDLKAAAFATYDGRPAICCILGTGSNSCVFDGKQIDNSVPALGYILGDEGSGSYFGKQLLTAFLYGELPSATQQLLSGKYDLTKEKIFSAVYNESHANVYLASFSKVLSESPDQEFIRPMVYEGFYKFFRHHVACYQGNELKPVHFVGSLAYHFRDILQQVADAFQYELGAVDRQPVFKLLDWHERQKEKQL